MGGCWRMHATRSKEEKKRVCEQSELNMYSQSRSYECQKELHECAPLLRPSYTDCSKSSRRYLSKSFKSQKSTTSTALGKAKREPPVCGIPIYKLIRRASICLHKSSIYASFFSASSLGALTSLSATPRASSSLRLSC